MQEICRGALECIAPKIMAGFLRRGADPDDRDAVLAGRDLSLPYRAPGLHPPAVDRALAPGFSTALGHGGVLHGRCIDQGDLASPRRLFQRRSPAISLHNHGVGQHRRDCRRCPPGGQLPRVVGEQQRRNQACQCGTDRKQRGVGGAR